MLRTEGVEEETTAGDAPIIKMVSMLLLEAYNHRASDIHLEPLEKEVSRPLPHRRRAARDGEPAQKASLRHHEPAQDHVGIDEHRRKTNPAGWPNPAQAWQEIDRSPSFEHPDHPRRKHRHAHPGQNLAGAGASRSGLPFRRSAQVRAAHQHAGRNHPGHWADRIWQDDDSLQRAALHEQAGPQDHHRRGSCGIPAQRNQPGSGQFQHRNDISGRACARCCGRLRTSS